MQKNYPKEDPEKLVRVDRGMLISRAWLNLTGTACKVYLIFLTKRQGNWVEPKKGRKKNWVFTNLNKLEFTQIEASEKYKIPISTFRDTIKQLFEHGFLISIKSGGQLWHSKAVYGISDRWKAYGQAGFIPYKLKKGPKIGWRKSKK